MEAVQLALTAEVVVPTRDAHVAKSGYRIMAFIAKNSLMTPFVFRSVVVVVVVVVGKRDNINQKFVDFSFHFVEGNLQLVVGTNTHFVAIFVSPADFVSQPI